MRAQNGNGFGCTLAKLLSETQGSGAFVGTFGAFDLGEGLSVGFVLEAGPLSLSVKEPKINDPARLTTTVNAFIKQSAMGAFWLSYVCP
jgi:hypothetical protein